MTKYFIHNRILSSATNCYTSASTSQNKLTPKWLSLNRAQWMSKPHNSNSYQFLRGFSCNNGNQQQQQQQQGGQQQKSQKDRSSKTGKIYNLKKIKMSWSWKAGAGWTILSVLDWWLIAAGGWMTWRGIFLKWTTLGICIAAAVEWQLVNFECDKKGLPRTASQWQKNVYCSLPLRLISRGWGWIADCRVPIPMRPIVYGCYSTAFGVNLAEAASPDFKNYRSLSEFFIRELKQNARLIDAKSCLVSPADGTVLHFGLAANEYVEQVKGITYSLQSFLGPANWTAPASPEYANNIKLKSNEDTVLYQCVIYLAPGDYHRFHSPAEWKPEVRRHFAGELLSVSPKIAQWLPGLFCLNERALYLGSWQHGFFSFTAVGATNVGSIQIYIDEQLKTNKWKGLQIRKKFNSDNYDEMFLPKDVALVKGELLGHFNMGSTVVLVFEAPKSFQFVIKQGQKVKVGESLGCTGETSTTN